MAIQLSRRDLLRFSSLAAAGKLLPGCSGGQRYPSSFSQSGDRPKSALENHIHPQKQEPSPSVKVQQGRHRSKLEHYISPPKTNSGSTIGAQPSKLSKLKPGRDYVVLIGAYDDVKTMSELAGFTGNYGHIEVVRDGKVYGCRPITCGDISLAELDQKFKGATFEVREVRVEDDPQARIQRFNSEFGGKPYDFYYRNCTDATVAMVGYLGVVPINVDHQWSNNVPLRELLTKSGLGKPNRESVLLPDQFENVGTRVLTGRF
nr:hypothetical protein [Candidatus Woesearchaeota archaeon]